MAEGGNRSQILLGVAVVLAIGAGVYYFAGHKTTVPDGSAYYIDEETGEESVRSLKEIPPLPGKSGKPTVVREIKYSDDGGKTVKVAYYFKFDDNSKKKIEDAIAKGGGESDLAQTSGFVRTPEQGSKWIPSGSVEGQEIAHINIPQGKESSFSLVIPH